MAVLLAISGLAPTLSAVTYWPLALASRLMLPSEPRTSSTLYEGPMAVRLAISGLAPAPSAVT
jgi:hypothetical protein